MIYLAIITIGLILGLEFMGIRYRFPDQYEIYMDAVVEMLVDIKNKLSPYVINIGYNLLYGFSFCQIQMNKGIKLITPYVKDIKKYLKDNGFIEEVNLIIMDIIGKNGKVVNSLISRHDDKMRCQLNILEPYFEEENHMGILINDKNEKTGFVNKIFHEKIASTADYKLSKITFMMVELEHNGNKYTIELKNNTSNYYIVNNSLNQNFFKYYLNTILNVPINEANFDYTITIIDHNVNFITLLPHQHIVFNENDYTIFPILETTETNDTTESGETNDTCVPESTDTQLSNCINNDEQFSIDSDKSDDFVKLEPDI